jgi:signal transduction histidine kinase
MSTSGKFLSTPPSVPGLARKRAPSTFLPMQRRVLLFASAIVSALAILVWTGWTAWKAADQLGSRLSEQEVRSFRVGDTFSADLHELRSLFRNYEASRAPQKWEDFVAAHQRLLRWLRDQRGSITRPGELEILDNISKTFDEYWQEALRIRAEIATDASHAEVAPRIAVLGDYAADMAQGTRRLLRIREDALQNATAVARSRLNRLVKLLVGTLVAIVILSAALSILVYRDLIRPLRLQLVESRNLIARQEKLASLGVLAAGVAHEIRNPLTAIKARLFTQQKRLAHGSPAAADAEIIHSEIHRLERIVRGFLEFARPADPVPDRISARSVVSEVRDLLLPDAHSRAADIHVENGPDLFLHADRAQLKQVLINLVRNGLEALGESGEIRLRVQRVERQPRSFPSPAAIIEVGDTGAGIPPEARSRLFDPFFTTKADGTGLGLAIAARIVEKHGGSIEYRANPGGGTIFSVVLPLNP